MEKKETQLNVQPAFLMENQRGFFSKFGLPFLLFVSFVWLNLYGSMIETNSVFHSYQEFGSIGTYLASSAILVALIDYIIFEVYFFIYRLFIGFSIYSFMIPKVVMLDKFRKWYIFRNIVLGLIFNVRFFMPYISVYLCVIELILNFLFIFGLYFDLKKDYVEPLVAQYVFKTLTLPVFLYEAYVVITLMVGVL